MTSGLNCSKELPQQKLCLPSLGALSGDSKSELSSNKAFDSFKGNKNLLEGREKKVIGQSGIATRTSDICVSSKEMKSGIILVQDQIDEWVLQIKEVMKRN